MPPGYERVANAWRARLVPKAHSEEEMIHWLARGIPCLGPSAWSAEVHERCGPDGLKYVQDPKWNEFPKPKIAFHSRWAGPNTEMEDENLHTLVQSFTDVLTTKTASGAELNLQYFHRNDPTVDPPIPPLSELLKWPSFLQNERGGVACDNATRVSKRGAVTWWHLDDSGEFVMQTGLPLEAKGSVPVKVFLYANIGTYDWLMHDHEADVQGKIASLDIFKATDEDLPPSEYLPVLTIAVLYSGGPPLISPPNTPHLVITVEDTVMVEQRRVSNYWLDEMLYFFEKQKHWKASPLLYRYLRDNLQDEHYVYNMLHGLLLEASRNIPDSESPIIKANLMKRIAYVILAVANLPDYLNLSVASQQMVEAALKEDSPLAGVLTDAEKAFATNYMRVYRNWQTPREIFVDDNGTFFAVIYIECSPIFGLPRRSAAAAAHDHRELMKAAADGVDAVRKTRLSLATTDAVLDVLF